MKNLALIYWFRISNARQFHVKETEQRLFLLEIGVSLWKAEIAVKG